MPRHNGSATKRRGHRRPRLRDRCGPVSTAQGQCYATPKPKYKYPTERDAWEAIVGSPYLKTYRCPSCQCWHTARLRTRDLA